MRWKASKRVFWVSFTLHIENISLCPLITQLITVLFVCFPDGLLHHGDHHRQHRQPGQHGHVHHHPEGLGGGGGGTGQQQVGRSVFVLSADVGPHVIGGYLLGSLGQTLNPDADSLSAFTSGGPDSGRPFFYFIGSFLCTWWPLSFCCACSYGCKTKNKMWQAQLPGSSLSDCNLFKSLNGIKMIHVKSSVRTDRTKQGGNVNRLQLGCLNLYRNQSKVSKVVTLWLRSLCPDVT